PSANERGPGGDGGARLHRAWERSAAPPGSEPSVEEALMAGRRNVPTKLGGSRNPPGGRRQQSRALLPLPRPEAGEARKGESSHQADSFISTLARRGGSCPLVPSTPGDKVQG